MIGHNTFDPLEEFFKNAIKEQDMKKGYKLLTTSMITKEDVIEYHQQRSRVLFNLRNDFIATAIGHSPTECWYFESKLSKEQQNKLIQEWSDLPLEQKKEVIEEHKSFYRF